MDAFKLYTDYADVVGVQNLEPLRMSKCEFPMVYKDIGVVSNRQRNRQYKTCGSSYKIEPTVVQVTKLNLLRISSAFS